MRNVFRVFWEAIKDWWDELFILLLMNVVTTLLLIPVVTFPPALAGLWNAGNRAAQGKAIGWADYFEGFRRYFLKAWGLALLNILVFAVVSANVRFYSPDIAPFEISDTASTWISGFFVAIGFLWLVVQIYLMPTLLEQEDQRWRVALRNSAVLFIINPVFTIVLALLLFLVAAISTFFVLPWVLITLAFFAVVCNKAVLHLLEPIRERMRAEKEEEGQLAADDSQ